MRLLPSAGFEFDLSSQKKMFVRHLFDDLDRVVSFLLLFLLFFLPLLMMNIDFKRLPAMGSTINQTFIFQMNNGPFLVLCMYTADEHSEQKHQTY